MSGAGTRRHARARTAALEENLTARFMGSTISGGRMPRSAPYNSGGRGTGSDGAHATQPQARRNVNIHNARGPSRARTILNRDSTESWATPLSS